MARAAVPEQRENGEQLPSSVVVAQLRSRVTWLESALLDERRFARQLLLVIRLGRWSHSARTRLPRFPRRAWNARR